MIAFFIELVIWLVIVDAVLSWVQGENQMPRQLTRQLLAPIYAPIHAVLDPRKTGGMDLSPIIVIVLLNLIGTALGLR